MPSARTLLLSMLLAVALLPPSGCRPGKVAPPRSPMTQAVEAKAGDFADYWAEVLRLARLHAAHPDSFRVALEALPGSHLTHEEWRAWVGPYEAAPGELATSLEEAIATVAPLE
mgnify:CR=1 FL=1